MRLGIDFGTCYSSSAFLLRDGLVLVKEPLSHTFSFPSSLYITQQGEVLVGQAAENQRLRTLFRYRSGFKRDLGQQEPFQLGERAMQPEELVAEVLKKLKTEAEQMNGGAAITSAVLTVPAIYADYKRGLMARAGMMAGLEVALLDEPVATAIYHTWKADAEQRPSGGEVVLVYDLGGGTFDAALVRKTEFGYELLAIPVGLEQCGGIDLDRMIFDHLKQNCSQELRDLLEQRNEDAMRLRAMVTEWCRGLKHQLSEAKEAFVSIPVPGAIAMEPFSLDRATFNEMVSSLVKETTQLCHKLVEMAGIGWESVDYLLMVGGCSRIPYVKELLENEFQCRVERVDDPELAISRGAAIYAAELEQRDDNPVVSANGGWGLFSSISEAIQTVKPETRIQVEPGIYRETLIIDKPVEITGAGAVDQIIVESETGPCISMQTERATLNGLTLRRAESSRKREKSESRSHDAHCAVSISQGKLTMVECRVTSQDGPCILISGAQTDPLIRKCRIHNGKETGVAITEGAAGTLEHCKIVGNRGPGIAVSAGAAPKIDHCNIRGGKSNGICFSDNGMGSVEYCDIRGTEKPGVSVDAESAPNISHSNIHFGKQSGLWIQSRDGCLVEECDIHDNQEAGLVIGPGGNPEIRSCRIHDGTKEGVLTLGAGKGIFKNCDIFSNSGPGASVTGGSDPRFIHCRIYDGKDSGVVFDADAVGSLDQCEIHSNTNANVISKTGASPGVRRCSIHDGKMTGISVIDSGRGQFIECDVFSNGKSGVEIKRNGDPLFSGCKIHDAIASEIIVSDKGLGTFENCDISKADNGAFWDISCMEITDGASPSVRGCKLHGNAERGFLIKTTAKCSISECELFDLRCGLYISGRASPVIRNCTLRDNDVGIIFDNQAQGMIERCVIKENSVSGIQITERAQPLIRVCKIHENLGVGVFVSAQGRTTLEDCTIEKNTDGSWEIEPQSDVNIVWSHDPYQKLRELLARSGSNVTGAIRETFRLVREITGHQCIDKKRKMRGVPYQLLSNLNEVWVQAGHRPLSQQVWFSEDGEITTVGWFSDESWMLRRLHELGL